MNNVRVNPKLDEVIVNSALWAAAGDALGWISELTDDKGLRRRIGGSELREPVAWKRKIGGISGVQVPLPAGTYSDDTQLRLAVCRAIRSDGSFDVELFAKIELTVWPSYALGAGRGSKAAASNLTRRDVNWFSNFFVNDGRSYIEGGGNGAAMRIQPHVWHRGGGEDRAYLIDVIRDSVTTHGHMLGLCGAVFHADCLAYTMRQGEAPGPEEWMRFVDGLKGIEGVIREDFQLGRFWLSAWEQASKRTLSDAIGEVAAEIRRDIIKLREVSPNWTKSYADCITILDGYGSRQGTGTNTALAAAFLAWAAQDSPIEDVLRCAANTLGSDTDTIGTMVGALLGALAERSPTWEVQDRQYIEGQARRLAAIAVRQRVDNFPYPDLIGWQAPSTQADAVAETNGHLALAGLGLAEPVGKGSKAGEFVWQWLKLEFGQTVLCKAREGNMREMNPSLMPGPKGISNDSHEGKLIEKSSNAKNPEAEPSEAASPTYFRARDRSYRATLAGRAVERDLFDDSGKDRNVGGDRAAHTEPSATERPPVNINALTDVAIRSGFDATTIGDCFLACIDDEQGIEHGIGFAAILAKAYLARKRKRG